MLERKDISFAGCVHSCIADILRAADDVRVAKGEGRVVRDEILGRGGPYWKLAWRVPAIVTAAVNSNDGAGASDNSNSIQTGPELPKGLVWDTVRTDQDVKRVMETNSLVRIRSQILNEGMTSAAVRDVTSGRLVGWAYLCLHGSVRTMFVEEGWRGRGLAKAIVQRLEGAKRGEGGVDGKGGQEWMHTDVAEDNAESRGLFEKNLGATKCQESYWIRVDLGAAARVVESWSREEGQ